MFQIILICLVSISCYDLHMTQEEIREEINKKYVNYGSTVRIIHYSSEYFLHSHQVSYGTGSGQQSVTGIRANNDYNSLWTIKECQNQAYKKYDDKVKCGDCIRLEHMLTKKNLHSHNYQSPLSGNGEVSAYGDDGNGDYSDDWMLECQPVSNSVFQANTWYYLKHRVTGKYLRMGRTDQYNVRNCGHHCPIEGQLEVSASHSKSVDNKWKIHSGLFYEQIDNTVDENGRHCNSYGDCEDIDAADDEYHTVPINDL